MNGERYVRRLIEVDLPIKEVSAHARREKSIRHGHISTLHIWWARRPLAACRAVTCASLWPDPADEACPRQFLADAGSALETLRSRIGGPKYNYESPIELRRALLAFIGEFANWDRSEDQLFLDAARAITAAAHRSLRPGAPTQQFVLDPFAGGGAIPVEASRLGLQVFASDLNPVPVLLNRAVLSYIPEHGQALQDAVERAATIVHERARQELAEYYPLDEDGGVPIAYLWARTVRCEGPGCGSTVPLVRTKWLSKKSTNLTAFRFIKAADESRLTTEIVLGDQIQRKDADKGTVARGSATCQVCGYTTPVKSVRRQLSESSGGADTAQMIAVVVNHQGVSGRSYRVPTDRDLDACERARIARASMRPIEGLSPIPDELISTNELRRISVPLYGMSTWGDLHTARQAISLAALSRFVRELPSHLPDISPPLIAATQTMLALVVDRQADASSSLARWHVTGEKHTATFGRQAIGMVWDFSEVNVLSESTGGLRGAIAWVQKVIAANSKALTGTATVCQASATQHPLPDDIADAVVTDPPYYDAVPYSHLSDFFYVWLRRMLRGVHPDLFQDTAVPKAPEIVVDRRHSLSTSNKDVAFYEGALRDAFAEARRVLRPDGIATVVFASKSTASWEAVLGALVDAGFIVTASWPIDTEMAAKVAAIGQARLMSSVHLVCRPRERPDGSLREDEVGDWRAVLRELPLRIHEWMPRLASEGVVGADAIFACLGPALEVYSRHSRVEKVSGERVELGEYLEAVWAAVAREALTMIFHDADTAGFEADARLSAMWLWTLSTAAESNGSADTGDDDGDDELDQPVASSSSYSLEYDAARKIAQGLGAHLEELTKIVEVKGDTARLLAVSERARTLFGQAEHVPTPRGARRGNKQMALFAAIDAAEEQEAWGELGAPSAGETTLDRVHQAMLLFGSGRSEALKRFLIEEGVGREPRFWKLAQALSALYPEGTAEKRWVDGVHARKKGMGFG